MCEEKMTERHESCPECGRYTTRGQEQLAREFRKRPISGIDLTKPLSELVESIRSEIANSRGKLNDISMGFTGWREHLASIEGLLTCGLVSLHHVKERMQEHERLYPKDDSDNAATAP